MTLLDYLDAADPWAVIAVMFLALLVLEAVVHELSHRRLRALALLERLQGYEHGYRDGHQRALSAIRVDDDTVPEAFTREFRRRP